MTPPMWIALVAIAVAGLAWLVDNVEPPRWTARVLEGGARSSVGR